VDEEERNRLWRNVGNVANDFGFGLGPTERLSERDCSEPGWGRKRGPECGPERGPECCS
jgi:hypothetical protein